MNVAEGDYVVCKEASKEGQGKPFLLHISKIKGEKIGGILEDDRHLKEEKHATLISNVICNLGQSPKPGKYGNIDARDIYRKTFTHEDWGHIHFFTRPSKPLRKAVKKALTKTAVRMSAMGFEHVFAKVVNEIRTPRGKYAGSYHHGGKKKASRLKLFLKEEHANEMNYVLYHECGHLIRFHYLKNPRVRAEWLRLFNISVPKKAVKQRDFEEMFKALEKAQPETLKSFASDYKEDEDALCVLKTATRYMKQVHRVSVREVNVLLEAGKFDQLGDLWPDRTIDVNDLDPLVSEYACKDVEELFAEAFAFYMVKKKLPKSVKILLEKSLAYAKNIAKQMGDKDDDEE